MGQIDDQKQVAHERRSGCTWAMWIAGAVLLIWILWQALYLFDGPTDEDRMRAQTLSNFKRVATALQLYVADNDDKFPPQFSTHEDLRNAVGSYVRTESAFETRNPNGAFETPNPNGGEMMPNSELAGIMLSSVVDQGKTAVIYETKDWPNGEFVVSTVDNATKFVGDRDSINFDPCTIESETVD